MTAVSVSVIIPAFNAAPFVGEAIESVLRQTSKPSQIIVIDDGSTDDTEAVVRQYADRVSYLRQLNQGVAAARNAGLRRATGEFVAFLDADDVWHPEKLERQISVLRANEACGLLGTDVFDWPAASPLAQLTGNGELVEVAWRDLAVRNYFTTSSVIVRRKWLNEVGIFDTNLHGPEDYDMWLRVSELTATANITLSLTGYRTVAGSLGQQAITMQCGLRRILEKMTLKDGYHRDWVLRRKAMSYCDSSCAYLFKQAGDYRTAVSLLVRSLVYYPWPYRHHEISWKFVRLRLLLASLRASIGPGL